MVQDYEEQVGVAELEPLPSWLSYNHFYFLGQTSDLTLQYFIFIFLVQVATLNDEQDWRYGMRVKLLKATVIVTTT